MFKYFLPLILSAIILVTPLFGTAYFGAQIEGRVTTNISDWVAPNHIYQVAIKISDCYNDGMWYCPEYYEDDIKKLEGNDIIVGIKVVPESWRIYPTNPGSPPEYRYCSNLGDFLFYLKDRFPSINLFELFNEPDVPIDVGNTYGEYFGAWVINDNYYDSGISYGRCMLAATNRAKSLDKNIKVGIGALIGSETSFTFLKGMLSVDNNYDALTFHKYLGIKDSFDTPFRYADRLREYTNKPIVMTETSIISAGNSIDESTAELQSLQAQYITYLIQNSPYSNIDAWLWYTLANNGWRNSDLVFRNVPRPAYYSFVGYPGVGGGKENPPNYILLTVIILLFFCTIIITVITIYENKINREYRGITKNDK